MTGEQLLNSLRYLEYEIKALDTQRVKLSDCRQDILDRAECLNAPLTGVNVQHPIGSKTETLGIQLADLDDIVERTKRVNALQAKVNSKIDELVDRKQIALDIIEKVECGKCRALLINRFVNNLKWPTVADVMGYNEHYVRVDLRGEAVGKFCAIYESEGR